MIPTCVKRFSPVIKQTPFFFAIFRHCYQRQEVTWHERCSRPIRLTPAFQQKSGANLSSQSAHLSAEVSSCQAASAASLTLLIKGSVRSSAFCHSTYTKAPGVSDPLPAHHHAG
ncbi:uncharacterized [Tachysurus ichikawai]